MHKRISLLFVIITIMALILGACASTTTEPAATAVESTSAPAVEPTELLKQPLNLQVCCRRLTLPLSLETLLRRAHPLFTRWLK
jgi:hypothetical protein